MAHSAFNRSRMMTLIREADAAGTAMPTDGEIADHFGFDNIERARTLLADLADRGEIRLRGTGAARTITLGRSAASTPFATPRPVPTVKRPGMGGDAELDQAVARLKAIATRGKAAAIPSPPRPEPTGKEPGTADTTPTRSQEVGRYRAERPADLAEGRQVGASPAVIPTPTPARAAHQVNCKVDAATRDALVALAAREGLSLTGAATRVLREATANLDAPSVVALSPPCKPLVTAAMVLTAQRDGTPLDRFVAMIMARGFESYRRDAAAERAA